MNRFIRWQGIAAFTVLVGLVVAFVLLFAEPLLKSQLTDIAQQQNKAEVNIGEVNIHYFPFGLSLKDVQVTNAKTPSENLISFTSMSAKVDLWQFWFGKTIIDEISVEQLALNNQRATPGKLYESEPEVAEENADVSDDSGISSTIKQVELPSADSVLSDTNLLTVKNSEILQTSYKEEKAKLEQVKADLPDKDALASYETQLKQLTDREIKSADDLKQLKVDFEVLEAKFKKDKGAIKAAKNQLAASKERLSPQISALKNSPSQDWQMIEEKYQMGEGGSAAIAELLFGDKAGQYIGYVETAYSYIKPFIGGDDNAKEQEVENTIPSQRFVHFKEDNPLPEFLLRKGLIDLVLPEGDFSFDITDLTNQHWVQNKETSIEVISENAGSVDSASGTSAMKKSGQVKVNYNFALKESGTYQSNGDWTVSQYPLENVNLVDKSNFVIQLDSALLKGQGSLTNQGENIESTHGLVIENTKYSGTTDSSLQKSILKVLQDSNVLTADFVINGKVSSPKVNISSSIDDIFVDAIKSEGKEKLATFKTKVQSGLQQKLADSLNVNDQEFAQLMSIESELESKDKLMQDLLTSNVVKNKTDELNDKLKNKLGDKLKKLF